MTPTAPALPAAVAAFLDAVEALEPATLGGLWHSPALQDAPEAYLDGLSAGLTLFAGLGVVADGYAIADAVQRRALVHTLGVLASAALPADERRAPWRILAARRTSDLITGGALAILLDAELHQTARERLLTPWRGVVPDAVLDA